MKPIYLVPLIFVSSLTASAQFFLPYNAFPSPAPSPFGRLQTRLRTVKALRPDVVNLPYNQGHTAVGRWAKDRGVNGLEILNPASEPVTGLAALTNTRVRVYRA